MVACPALLIAAPASGQGKTTVTAALARLHARAGRRVRVLKCGPDFLDPQIHATASGAPCYNVDLGMCGETDVARRLAMSESDLYRKQRVAIENVARTVANMERTILDIEEADFERIPSDSEPVPNG